MNTANGDNFSSSDLDELMQILEEDKCRSERLRLKLGSTPLAPSKHSKSAKDESVFGVDVNRTSKQVDRLMKTIVRERTERRKIEQDVAQLRVSQGGITNERDSAVIPDEKRVAEMAAAEIRKEDEEQQKFEKYYRPAELFIRLPSWPGLFKSKWEPRNPGNVDPIQQMVIIAQKEGYNLHQRFPFLVKTMCEKNRRPPQYIATMLFHRVVYEPSNIDRSHSREHELMGLLEYIRSTCSSNTGKFLPSMVEVLGNYGAVLSVSEKYPAALRKAHRGSLDDEVNNCGNELNQNIEKKIRNLCRAFKIWTALQKNGVKYSTILGNSRTSTVGQLSTAANYSFAISEICIRVLLSPFGSRLEVAVEPFLTSIFSSVARTDWIEFRQKFSMHISKHTTRLGLQVDLIEYLLPSCSDRTRTLRLDAAYMTLRRWHLSPEIPTQEYAWPVGNRPISFRMSNVLDCIEDIPEITTRTDEVWILLLARLIRILLLDVEVLSTKKAGDIAKVHSWERKMRLTSSRNIPHGIESYNFQYYLSTMITTMHALLGNEDGCKFQANVE